MSERANVLVDHSPESKYQMPIPIGQPLFWGARPRLPFSAAPLSARAEVPVPSTVLDELLGQAPLHLGRARRRRDSGDPGVAPRALGLVIFVEPAMTATRAPRAKPQQWSATSQSSTRDQRASVQLVPRMPLSDSRRLPSWRRLAAEEGRFNAPDDGRDLATVRTG